MILKHNDLIDGKHNKQIVIDVTQNSSATNAPIIIFCHGYKGFKDWGAWNVMAKTFAEARFLFIKFNFSHNGGTVKQPIDFPDLEGFGNNNYTKELDDLESVIDWVMDSNLFKHADVNNINLMGHSRGGGIVCIKAEEDPRIKRAITLAGVSDFASRFPIKSDLKQWKQDGVIYVENARTKQQMPHFYQFYDDFIKNENRLTIKRAVSNMTTPLLIIHGDSDTSVRIDEAKNLHQWQSKSDLKIIKGANHVFNANHPWHENKPTNELKEAVNAVIKFIK